MLRNVEACTFVFCMNDFLYRAYLFINFFGHHSDLLLVQYFLDFLSLILPYQVEISKFDDRQWDVTN